MPTSANQDFLKEAARILASLPPVKPKVITKPKLQTCCCGKEVSIDKLEPVNTGVFITHNDVCKGCKEGKRLDQTHARLVCAKCKKVLMHIPPGTDKSGFSFEANKSYHLESCPQCDTSGKQNFTIIEKAMWNRTHGIARNKPLGSV